MKRYYWSPIVFSFAWMTLIGCDEQAADRLKPAAEVVVAAVPAIVSAEAQSEPWGDITGRIIWGGDKIPDQGNLNLKGNPDAGACTKDGPVKDETWIVNPKNKGLKNTFVWLEGAKKGDKLPIHPNLKKVAADKIEIDQPSYAFISHAVALREGQILVAKNSSAIGHNFKWTGNPTENPGGNVLLPPGASKDIDDLKADRIPISIECNIHAWMRRAGAASTIIPTMPLRMPTAVSPSRTLPPATSASRSGTRFGSAAPRVRKANPSPSRAAKTSSTTSRFRPQRIDFFQLAAENPRFQHAKEFFMRQYRSLAMLLCVPAFAALTTLSGCARR